MIRLRTVNDMTTTSPSTRSPSTASSTSGPTELDGDATALIARFLEAWNDHQDLRTTDATVLARLASRRRLDELRLHTRRELDALGLSVSEPALAA